VTIQSGSGEPPRVAHRYLGAKAAGGRAGRRHARGYLDQGIVRSMQVTRHDEARALLNHSPEHPTKRRMFVLAIVNHSVY
jgi:hypothetical protein